MKIKNVKIEGLFDEFDLLFTANISTVYYPIFPITNFDKNT